VKEPCTAYTSSRLDYDPFGMLTVGRSWQAGSEYRFGFGGMENDDEIAGNDNALDFGAGIYDARLGRWLSVDPSFYKYSFETPYSFCSSSPIAYVDDNGKDKTLIHIYIDKKTGEKVVMKVVVSNELLTESFTVQPNNPHSQDELNYAYYDFSVTYTHYIDDGKEVSVEKGDKVKGEKRGETKYPAEEFMEAWFGRLEWGGVNWTSSTGQGQETKKGTIDVKQEDLDLLLSALSVAKADKPEAGAKVKILEYFMYGLEASGVVDNLASLKSELIDTPKESTFKCNYENCGDTITKKQQSEHGGPFEEIKDED